MISMTTQWLTEQMVSAKTQIPVKTLRDWRYRKVNLPFSRIGTLVRYSETEIDEYIASQTVEVRTSQPR